MAKSGHHNSKPPSYVHASRDAFHSAISTLENGESLFRSIEPLLQKAGPKEFKINRNTLRNKLGISGNEFKRFMRTLGNERNNPRPLPIREVSHEEKISEILELPFVELRNQILSLKNGKIIFGQLKNTLNHRKQGDNVKIDAEDLRDALGMTTESFDNFIHTLLNPYNAGPEKQVAHEQHNNPHARAKIKKDSASDKFKLTVPKSPELAAIRATLKRELFDFEPRSDGQQSAIFSVRQNELSILTGPAGSGKTRIAMHRMLELLRDDKINTIAIIRPIAGAGGKELGFLPGSLAEKEDNYLRATLEMLVEIVGVETAERLIETNIVQMKTAMFLRGVNLGDGVNGCGLIIDEGQNFNEVELKLVLGRPKATESSNACPRIITGDITQNDVGCSDPELALKKCQILANKVDLIKDMRNAINTHTNIKMLSQKTELNQAYLNALTDLHLAGAEALSINNIPYLEILCQQLSETDQFGDCVIELDAGDIQRDRITRDLTKLGILGRNAARECRAALVELLAGKAFPSPNEITLGLSYKAPANGNGTHLKHA